MSALNRFRDTFIRSGDSLQGINFRRLRLFVSTCSLPIAIVAPDTNNFTYLLTYLKARL